MTLGLRRPPVTQITRSNDAYVWTNHYAISRNYTANGLNQYTAIGGITPSYDSRGNLTSAGSDEQEIAMAVGSTVDLMDGPRIKVGTAEILELTAVHLP